MLADAHGGPRPLRVLFTAPCCPARPAPRGPDGPYGDRRPPARSRSGPAICNPSWSRCHPGCTCWSLPCRSGNAVLHGGPANPVRRPAVHRNRVASRDSSAFCPHCARRYRHGSPRLPAPWNQRTGTPAHQPSWGSMRRALASICISPAGRPRLASRSARSRTTSTTWTRSPDASFSMFVLYRRDQLLSPPLSTVYTPQPIFETLGSRSQDASSFPG
jgi:hypothetical protein